MAAPAGGGGDGWHCVGCLAALAAGSGRLHACVGGRYISVLRVAGRLAAIDSVCYHAGGPLGLGDIEEFDARSCLVCPWHSYKVDVFTGEKLFQSVTWQDGKMVPGPWKSNGKQQRTHSVEARADGHLWVRLDASAGEVPSDAYACRSACGSRLTDPAAASSAPGAAGGPQAGADGRRDAGWLARVQQMAQKP